MASDYRLSISTMSLKYNRIIVTHDSVIAKVTPLTSKEDADKILCIADSIRRRNNINATQRGIIKLDGGYIILNDNKYYYKYIQNGSLVSVRER